MAEETKKPSTEAERLQELVAMVDQVRRMADDMASAYADHTLSFLEGLMLGGQAVAMGMWFYEFFKDHLDEIDEYADLLGRVELRVKE